MGIGKGAYLKKLTSRMQFKSVNVGQKMEGSSPPGVFIGTSGYPKVFIGPMLSPQYGDTSLLDTPESWIINQKQLEDIVNFRLQLVRGKLKASIDDLDNRIVRQLQEMSLADSSLDCSAEFSHAPNGVAFSDEHAPYGPSAALKKFEPDIVRWDHNLEKTYYDTDLSAKDAVIDLYKEGLIFSKIQKAFSTGTVGLGKNRKLVPTRWSITAVDSTLASYLLEKVKQNDIIDNYLVYEFGALNNYFIIMLTPTAWQYEWMEAFIKVLGDDVLIFSDYELYKGKKEYSTVGGCYYSVKYAVCEKLAKDNKQAGAIVFREAYPGYIPTGVWLCREETKKAFCEKPKEFYDLSSTINYIKSRLRLPFSRFIERSILLKEIKEQKRLIAWY